MPTTILRWIVRAVTFRCWPASAAYMWRRAWRAILNKPTATRTTLPRHNHRAKTRACKSLLDMQRMSSTNSCKTESVQQERMHECIYLCMHACMHVCVYVCLYKDSKGTTLYWGLKGIRRGFGGIQRCLRGIHGIHILRKPGPQSI